LNIIPKLVTVLLQNYDLCKQYIQENVIHVACDIYQNINATSGGDPEHGGKDRKKKKGGGERRERRPYILLWGGRMWEPLTKHYKVRWIISYQAAGQKEHNSGRPLARLPSSADSTVEEVSGRRFYWVYLKFISGGQAGRQCHALVEVG
jgi:hypothetical protein